MAFDLLSQLLIQFRRFWHCLLPSPCLWCSLPVQHFNRQLCPACAEALPQLPYLLCHYNLLWLPQVSRGLEHAGFDQLLSISYYQQPYRHWLQRWKFDQDYAAGELLQQLFSGLLAQYAKHQRLPEAILYVPMHPAKQRKRGFNPAQLLAQAAARQLRIPLISAFSRPQQQQAQVGLNRKQRQKNLRSTFVLNDAITLPKRVALVDDVVTTGATANALCRLLRRGGVSHISIWTVAVTLSD
uniref:Competence protein F homolog, phosphoribosyltransferase domain protein YhgH required for utilization of DNA as sole source of carbon and energy n=1 Tax=Rheinheimera sp. BAL341 TaxID=1708203 RepID=A0A486XVM8_9GAMM